jgi:hypothetical protein
MERRTESLPLPNRREPDITTDPDRPAWITAQAALGRHHHQDRSADFSERMSHIAPEALSEGRDNEEIRGMIDGLDTDMLASCS